MWGQGSLVSNIAFIGEAPGEDEDFDGKPFVGRAGKQLDWGLLNAGIYRYQTWLTNVISCRPPSNNMDCPEAIEAVECCRPGFLQEMAFLEAKGIKVLVPLGNHALNALDLPTGITTIRGSVYQRGELVVVPTLHPSFIMRGQHQKKNQTETLHVSYKYVWVADLKKARALSQGNWEPPRENFNLAPTFFQVMEWCQKAIASNQLVAVDIETAGPDIVVIGLACSPHDAISIPLLNSDQSPYWSPLERRKVDDQLNLLFQGCPLMFQYALFDVPRLRAAGYHIGYENVKHDTLLLHHCISPELPHNLAFIVSVYGDTPYWKGTLRNRKGSIFTLSNQDLRTYNLRDVVVLHQVLNPLLDDIEEMDTYKVYEQEAIPLLGPVGEMMETGFNFDRKRLAQVVAKWKEEADVLEAKLRSSAKIPAAFNLGSDDDLRWFLWKEAPTKFSKLAQLEEFERADKPRKKGTKVHRELLDLRDIRDEVQHPYQLASFSGRSTNRGARSVDKQGLLSFTIALQNRLQRVEGYKDAKFKAEARAIRSLLEWLSAHSEHRSLRKLLSTYSDYPVGADGRVHASFLPHGTATRRLASKDPNLQNLPKKRIEARSPFVASPGCQLVSGDYSNLEVRVLAYETRDQALIDILEKGHNVHDENTRVLFGLAPDHPKFAVARRAAKVFMFGGLAYGGGDREVYEKVVLEAPELHLTFSQYREARERWMAEHPDYRRWAEAIRIGVIDPNSPFYRRAITFRGAVRELTGPEADIQKEALNTPIQGGAAHIINEAMIRIHRRKAAEYKARLVAQVHDQLVYDVPEREVERFKPLLVEEMERPVDYRGIQVIFPVDLEIGTSWGEMKKCSHPFPMTPQE